MTLVKDILGYDIICRYNFRHLGLLQIAKVYLEVITNQQNVHDSCY